MGLTTEQLHFTDAKVCRNFLCGTCPHDLFSNTKVDLGPCPKSHTARLKDEYKASITTGGKRYPEFEAEHEDNIRRFMADIDRKISANKRRIDQTPEETAKFANLLRDISEIEAAMNAAMAEVERLGEQGEVDASLGELAKAEALKQEKADREHELQVLSDSAGASGHQKLRVCDVCGAYLSILDSDRRLADHFGGRMHLGYLRLREIITEFDERRAKGEDPRTLMARGVGSSTSAAATATNGHAPHHDDPRSSRLNGGAMNGASSGRSYGAMPADYYGASSASSSYYQPQQPNPSRDRDRDAGPSSLSYGDGDRDAERDRRERERRERREGRDARDRDGYGGGTGAAPPTGPAAGAGGGAYRSSRYDGAAAPARRSRSPEDRDRHRDRDRDRGGLRY